MRHLLAKSVRFLSAVWAAIRGPRPDPLWSRFAPKGLIAASMPDLKMVESAQLIRALKVRQPVALSGRRVAHEGALVAACTLALNLILLAGLAGLLPV